MVFNFLEFLKKHKITSIVSDSTNSLIDGKTPSEDFAYKGLQKVIKKSKMFYKIIVLVFIKEKYL